MIPPSICLFASLLFSLWDSAAAASTDDWKSRSIYQVMTDRFARSDGSTDAPCDLAQRVYCGGTWRGIINQLDYIQGMGFDAIYISPVTKNLEGNTPYGEAYHGYWPQDLYALDEHFGTADDLRALSDELHQRGMYFMVDVIINNMAFATYGEDPATSIDYSVLKPFDDERFYHPWCEVDNYGDYTEAQLCSLGDSQVALPDLNTESGEVSNMMNDWVGGLVQDYSLDGLRVDAAKHVNDGFLESFAAAAGVFTVGEVFENDTSLFCPYQELMPSMTNYPNYDQMIEAFSAGDIDALTQATELTKQTCADTTALGSFSENHDIPRFASYTNDLSLGKTVLAWTVLADGIPMIYQGQEQGFSGRRDPFNREAVWTSSFNTDSELYQFVKLLNAIRRHAITVNRDYLDYQSRAVYSDDSTVAFRKGFDGRQIVSVLSSGGEATPDDDLSVSTTYAGSVGVTDVVTCEDYTTDGDGQLVLPMGGGLPHVLFPSSEMDGSGLCGF